MTSYPKRNLLPDHIRNAIRAYLRKASPDRPVVISSVMREIRTLSEPELADDELKINIATEALEAGLNIHFDGPNE
ncbi:hypothetical protein EET67_23365 [Pseudaminobacter arsenicus]|uniref:Histidine kinase n=1 Tax=Borborobacter arsenicus TaxID=1851146 RepID=A0A432UZQ8_9HYPH|nr:hypothetical protein [Pseudaminobacter arsenicus]RUM95426.1 hypothetical protein EET67_23365 [Pseudaminobacter arsenicus]